MHPVSVDLHRRRIGLRIGLVHVDPGAGTQVETLAQQLPVAVLGLIGILRQVKQVLIGLERQPGTGHFADQRQACGLVIALRRFEPGPGGIALAANATEQVQLVGRETTGGLEGVGNTAGTVAAIGRAHQRRQLAASGIGVDANGREQPGLRTGITRPRLFDTGRELAQAAVVGQRQVDQLAQAVIDHKAAPVLVERLLARAAFAGRVGRPLLVDRRIGFLVGRLQRTTTQQKQ